jgi:hypothetical protein
MTAIHVGSGVLFRISLEIPLLGLSRRHCFCVPFTHFSVPNASSMAFSRSVTASGIPERNPT